MKADHVIWSITGGALLGLIVWYLVMATSSPEIRPCHRVDIVATPSANPQRLCPHPDHLANIQVIWVQGGLGEAVQIACVCEEE